MRIYILGVRKTGDLLAVYKMELLHVPELQLLGYSETRPKGSVYLNSKDMNALGDNAALIVLYSLSTLGPS